MTWVQFSGATFWHSDGSFSVLDKIDNTPKGQRYRLYHIWIVLRHFAFTFRAITYLVIKSEVAIRIPSFLSSGWSA